MSAAEEFRAEPCSMCAAIPGVPRPAAWSPAFGAWLCDFCRQDRTEAALRETKLAAGAIRVAAAQEAVREASRDVNSPNPPPRLDPAA